MPKKKPTAAAASADEEEQLIRVALAAEFAFARAKMGVSKAAFAEALGTSRRWIGAIEAGLASREIPYDFPNVRLLVSLYRLTGCDALGNALATVRPAAGRKPCR